jgi:hypothetical protein
MVENAFPADVCQRDDIVVVPEGLDERSLAVYCLESVYEGAAVPAVRYERLLPVHRSRGMSDPGIEADRLVPSGRRFIHTVPTARVRY